MKQNKIRLTESQLKQFINETVSQILEYNDEWLKKVGDCGFLSDEDKKSIQIASMNNWDNHERERRRKSKIWINLKDSRTKISMAEEWLENLGVAKVKVI